MPALAHAYTPAGAFAGVGTPPHLEQFVGTLTYSSPRHELVTLAQFGHGEPLYVRATCPRRPFAFSLRAARLILLPLNVLRAA